MTLLERDKLGSPLGLLSPVKVEVKVFVEVKVEVSVTVPVTVSVSVCRHCLDTV